MVVVVIAYLVKAANFRFFIILIIHALIPALLNIIQMEIIAHW